VLTTATPGVPVSGSAFFANGATGSSLTAGVLTKVSAFTSELFDLNNDFNSTTSRFQPTVAGYYMLSSSVRADTSTSVLHVYMMKNGSIYASGGFVSLSAGTTNNASTVSTLMFLNGTSDYAEVYAFSGATNTTSTNAGQTWFSGVLVRAA
jgi:uncharacterized protein YgiB involved in biofilm formation